MFLTLLAKRLVLFATVIVVAASVNFFIPRLIPGNPIEEKLLQMQEGGSNFQIGMKEIVEAYNEKFGLDRSLLQQYVSFLKDMAAFDFGVSISNYPRRVSELIAEAMPWTLGLLVVSVLVAFTIGSLLGALSAWPGTARLFAPLLPALMIFSATPFYILGLLLLFAFGVVWPLFPTGGGYSLMSIPEPSLPFAAEVLHHAMLPALSIVLATLGTWALGMRGLMVMVRGEDYMRYAEARGLKPWRRLYRYGIRNAILPQITGLGMSLGLIIAGAVLVEVVFSYPGIGSLLYKAIFDLDYFLINGIVFCLILTMSVLMLIVDLVNPLLDPRIGATV